MKDDGHKLAVKCHKTGKTMWRTETGWTEHEGQATFFVSADGNVIPQATAALASYEGDWSTIGIQWSK